MERIRQFPTRLPASLIEKMDEEVARNGGSRNALIQRVFVERYKEQELQELHAVAQKPNGKRQPQKAGRR